MDAIEITTLPSNTPFSNALTCQKCGCHDPSVRQVIYPYVVSLVVITFRREFAGRWCWKHRTFYLLLAALITGTVGWFGFPFGLIYTPKALFRLAKGGVQHKASNLKLLRYLAEAHEQRGLLVEARRCIENSFQFVDDLWGRQELERYYAFNDQERKKYPGAFFCSPTWLIAGAVAFSFLAGLISFYADKVFDLPIGNSGILLGPFFLWIPLAIIFLLVLFTLRQIMENILKEHPYRNPVPIIGLALIAGILAAYGFLEGRAVGNFFDILQDQPLLPTGAAFWNMLGAIFTRGGLLEIPEELRYFEFWNSTHHILLTTVPVIFPVTLTLAAWPYAIWEKLLNQSRPPIQIQKKLPLPQIRGNFAPFAIIACLVGMLFPFSQQSVVDFIEARDHFYAGNVLMNEGNTDQSISEYRAAINLDPLFTAAFVELGWAYYQNDDNRQAIAQYTRAIDLGPDKYSMHYELGRIYYHDDQLEKASLEFEKAIQLAPDYYYAYLGIGWVAYDLGNLEKAEANFRKVLEYDDKEYDAYIGLGYIYKDRDQLDEEISIYQKAVEIDPGSAESHMLLGLAYYDKNELDLATASLEKAVDLESDNQLARFYLTLAYVYTGQPDSAVEFSHKTLELFPDWAGAHALLAFSLIETRKLDTAIAELEAARAITDKTDLDRSLIIHALLNAEKAKDAELEAQAAIKDGQHPSDFYIWLAEAYADQENFPVALTTCDQAARAGAHQSDVLICQASIHLDQDQYELSLRELQQALQLEPKSADAHYLMSLVYYNQDDFARALTEATQAVALNRYFYNAYLQVAMNQLNLGYSQESIKSASRAALLSPYADLPHYFLGEAYLIEGMDGLAGTELQKFLNLFDGSPSKQDLKEDAEKDLKALNGDV